VCCVLVRCKCVRDCVRAACVRDRQHITQLRVMLAWRGMLDADARDMVGRMARYEAVRARARVRVLVQWVRRGLYVDTSLQPSAFESASMLWLSTLNDDKYRAVGTCRRCVCADCVVCECECDRVCTRSC
jgi:hypothetical protein